MRMLGWRERMTEKEPKGWGSRKKRKGKLYSIIKPILFRQRDS